MAFTIGGKFASKNIGVTHPIDTFLIDDKLNNLMDENGAFLFVWEESDREIEGRTMRNGTGNSH